MSVSVKMRFALLAHLPSAFEKLLSMPAMDSDSPRSPLRLLFPAPDSD